MLQKLFKDEEIRRRPDQARQKLTDFLTPTAQSPESVKPTLNAFYAENFNAVDKFDAMLGRIPVPFKVDRPELRVFLSAIQTSLCNAFVLYEDRNSQLTASFVELLKLRQFAAQLAAELAE